MGTFTAEILVGNPHPNHDGIIPSHYLFLSENSRPAWIMTRQNIFNDNVKGSRIITWIPTVENMLDDAILMIAIDICKNEELLSLAKKFHPGIESDRIEMYADFEEDQRNQLYDKCSEINDFPKIIISVFKSSSIMAQLQSLDKYNLDVEVCTPSYIRLNSSWSKETYKEGSLDLNQKII